uniref:J domain-containing protein n=1 Tax=Opuntia streptacantha TaxID=393608 RepID=A0A7C8YPX8_OPUST
MASALTSTSSVSFHSLSSAFASPPCSSVPHRLSYVTFRRLLPSVSAIHVAADERSPTRSIAPSTSSFYEVLGIEMYATRHEIKAAYRKLVRVVHPDATSNGQKEAASSADDFIRVHEAYVTLSDPRKRADYDKTLLLRRRRISYSPNYAVATGRPATTSFSGFSGYTRRTWETDQCW